MSYNECYIHNTLIHSQRKKHLQNALEFTLANNLDFLIHVYLILKLFKKKTNPNEEITENQAHQNEKALVIFVHM